MINESHETYPIFSLKIDNNYPNTMVPSTTEQPALITSNLLLNEEHETVSGNVTMEQLKIIHIFVITCVLLTGTGGIVSNILNTITFMRLGLHDGMSVTLFQLTVADFALSFVAVVYVCSVAAQQAELWESPIFYLDPIIITIYFSNFGEMLYTCASLTTTMLAVARCASIAMPLQFKSIFTKTKTITSLAFIDIFAVASFVPILSSFETGEHMDDKSNRTRITSFLSSSTDPAMDVKSALVDTAITIITQVTVTGCLIIMAIKLGQAVKFRLLSQSLNLHENKMPSSNHQVLKQIILISAVFVSCNTPKVVIAIVRMIMPEFDARKQFGDIFVLTYKFKLITQVFSSAINIFIYYNYNKKFRLTVNGYRCKQY